jgi:hypothetical protein
MGTAILVCRNLKVSLVALSAGSNLLTMSSGLLIWWKNGLASSLSLTKAGSIILRRDYIASQWSCFRDYKRTRVA